MKVRPYLFVFSVSFLICSSLFFVGYQLTEKNELELVTNQAKVIRGEVEKRFQLYLRSAHGAEKMAGEFWAQGLVDESTYKAVAHHLRSSFSEVLGVNLLDPNGKIVRVYPEKENHAALGKTSQNIDALKEALSKNHEVWFSPPFYLFQGDWGFVYYLPLLRDGVHLGWLGVTVCHAQFFQHFNDSDFGQNFYISVRDVDSNRFYFNSAGTIPVPVTPLVTKGTFKEFGRTIEIIIWPKISSQLPSSSWSIPLFLGALVALLITVILAFRRGRQQSKRQLMDINQLLQLTTHDTSNSLTIVKGHLEIMKTSPHLVPVDRVVRHIGFMVELLDQIKLLQEMSKPKANWHKENHQLLPIILELSEFFNERIKQKQLQLIYDPEQIAGVKILVNRSFFTHSVLGNLIGNAIKFSPPGGKITISYKLSNGFHRISITDQGPGISKEALEKFKSKDAAPIGIGSHGEEGTGFGLLIAGQVCEIHGGKLELSSSAEGGTVATALIPQE